MDIQVLDHHLGINHIDGRERQVYSKDTKITSLHQDLSTNHNRKSFDYEVIYFNDCGELWFFDGDIKYCEEDYLEAVDHLSALRGREVSNVTLIRYN